jgi:hypothetical protein
MTKEEIIEKNYNEVCDVLHSMRVEAFKNNNPDCDMEVLAKYSYSHMDEDHKLAHALAVRLTEDEEYGLWVQDEEAQDADLGPVYSSGTHDKWAVLAFLVVAVVSILVERAGV